MQNGDLNNPMKSTQNDFVYTYFSIRITIILSVYGANFPLEKIFLIIDSCSVGQKQLKYNIYYK